jgi:RNA polymerase sigma-70 factor (ECF subfamily)
VTADSLSSEELAIRAEAGSRDSYDLLVKRYTEPLLAFLTQRVHNRHDAEDLVQDTFIRAHDKLHLFNAQYSFKTWLFTIAARLSYSHHRKSYDVPFDNVESVDEKDPATIIAQQEDIVNLWDLARRTLPSLQADALWLRYGEGLLIKEIAARMGRSQVYVKVLLHRGRSTLVSVLGSVENMKTGV